jgi:hypothetical protein
MGSLVFHGALRIAGCVVYMAVEILFGCFYVFRLEFLCSLMLVHFEFSMLCVNLLMSSFYTYCPVIFCCCVVECDNTSIFLKSN